MADKRLPRKDADALAADCIVFAARNGRTEMREESPVHSGRKLRYDGNGLTIRASGVASAFGNGGFSVTVRQKGRVLFEASGNYTAGPFRTEVKSFEDGPWVRAVRIGAQIIRDND